MPSTSKQLVFARFLYEELKHEGLEDVTLDDKGYIYATLPANIKDKVPVIGFISHYDTSPDCSGADIKPRIVNNYSGGDIELSEGIYLSPGKFPELLQHTGEDLIVTDGHTLLGAYDKAGIAEIVQPDRSLPAGCTDRAATVIVLIAQPSQLADELIHVPGIGQAVLHIFPQQIPVCFLPGLVDPVRLFVSVEVALLQNG